MGICVSCGHEYDDGTGFCTYCGTEHSADGAAAAAGRPQAGPASTTSAIAPSTTRPAAATPPDNAPLPALPPGGSRTSHGRRTLVIMVALILVFLSAASVAAVVLLRGDRPVTGTAETTPSPSPSPAKTGRVTISSLRTGDKVIGGEAVHVAVVASGVSSLVSMRLVVDGSATGSAKTHPSATFLWRTPSHGGTARLWATMTLSDGTVVRSRVIRVSVQPATRPIPTPTVTVTVIPSPPASGRYAVIATPFWAAFFKSSKTPNDAEQGAAQARSFGFTNARVLYTLDYANLGDGEAWYSAYLGPYDSEAEARAARDELRQTGFEPKAYYRQVLGE